MKRILLLSVVCLLITVPVHATEIYWDQTPPADPNITDSDFRFKYQGLTPSRSLGDLEVYDNGERLKLDYELEEEAAPPRVRASRTQDTVAPAPQPAPSARPAPTRAPRETARPARSERSKRTIETIAPAEVPAPRPTSPEMETTKPTPVPAAAAEAAPKNDSKKTMFQWGQEQAKPGNGTQTTEPQGKFNWGQPNQPK